MRRTTKKKDTRYIGVVISAENAEWLAQHAIDRAYQERHPVSKSSIVDECLTKQRLNAQENGDVSTQR
jgi:hypothetical protein